ncbi:MAG: secretin N-terminal domain-containing protein [Acidobacteriota bacterium]
MRFLLVALLVAASAMQAEPPAPDAAKALTVRTFTFRYKDADKAAGVIKPLLSAEGTMSIQPGTKSLVITDRAENLKALAKAIADFDVPPQSFRLSVRLVSAARVAGETAKPPDELRDIAPKLAMLRYNSLESAGQAEFEGKEGDPGIVEMTTGFRADFKLGEYDPASDSIKVSDFQLSRLQKDQLTSLLKTSLNLRLGQTYIVGATRAPESQRALMIVLVAHR